MNKSIANTAWRVVHLSLTAALLFFLVTGCSMQKLAVRSTASILENGLAALYEEEDLEIAETAIASELKLLEALARSDPGNKRLGELLCQGYASYALGFVEDKDKERAAVFYKRARNYGLEVLNKNRQFADAIKGTLDDLTPAVSAVSDKNIESLFWTTISWGLWINVQRHSPAAMAELPKVKILMNRVMELDETFYYGGPHLFFGLVNCIIPKMLGGNPEKGREHFEKALAVSENKFLIVKVFFAQYYAVQTQNDSLFTSLLEEVLNASLSILPEQKLINAVAKRKAEALLDRKDELFLTFNRSKGANL